MWSASLIVIGFLVAAVLACVIIHAVLKLQFDRTWRDQFKLKLDKETAARMEGARYGLDVVRPCERVLSHRPSTSYAAGRPIAAPVFPRQRYR